MTILRGSFQNFRSNFVKEVANLTSPKYAIRTNLIMKRYLPRIRVAAKMGRTDIVHNLTMSMSDELYRLYVEYYELFEDLTENEAAEMMDIPGEGSMWLIREKFVYPLFHYLNMYDEFEQLYNRQMQPPDFSLYQWL